MTVLRISLATVLWASTLCAAAAHAQAYVKIDTIQGESTDASYKDAIAIDSYSFGASSPSTVAGGGGASIGKATFDAIQFTHRVDRATAGLLSALAKGTHLKTAVLSVRRSAATAESMKVTLTDVIVTSVKVAGSADEPAREEVTLRFGKIQIEYFMQQKDGKTVPAGKFGWDIAKNTAI